MRDSKNITEMKSEVFEKMRDSKIIAELMGNCFLPKRIYIIEFEDENFPLNMQDWVWTNRLNEIQFELKWKSVGTGIYATTSFFREIIFCDTMEYMLRKEKFEGTYRLWTLKTQKILPTNFHD
jgi:hypothetical protein